MEIEDKDVKVKMSKCQVCNGIITAAVYHLMDRKSMNEFAKEVVKFNLSVHEISLDEYRSNETKWCSCKS